MAIVYSYVAFRHHFAQVARTQAVSLTYSGSAITRASGSFVTDGHQTGARLAVFSGTANEYGFHTIASVAALTMTVSETFTASETVISSLVSAFYENDEMERWPLALKRANGFDDGIVPSVLPMTPFPLTLTVNGGVTDVSAGTSYIWYLSQRTEIAANQHFTMTHADTARTGTVTLALTSTAVADLGLASTTSALNVGQRVKLLKYVYVFCQRQSDKAIQQAHLLPLSDAQPV